MRSVEFFSHSSLTSSSPQSRKRPERPTDGPVDPAETHPYVPPKYRNLDSRLTAALNLLRELDIKLEQEPTPTGRLLILVECKKSLSLIFALANNHSDFAERLASLEIFLKSVGEVYTEDKIFQKFVDDHKELKEFLQPFIDQRPDPLAEALKNTETVKRRLF